MANFEFQSAVGEELEFDPGNFHFKWDIEIFLLTIGYTLYILRTRCIHCIYLQTQIDKRRKNVTRIQMGIEENEKD